MTVRGLAPAGARIPVAATRARPALAEPVPASRSCRPRAMLLWSGWRPAPWTGLGLMRDGWQVTAAHPLHAPGAWTGGQGGVLRYPDPAVDEDAFVDWLSAACRHHRIDAVIPLDERIVEVVGRRARRLGGTRVAGPDAEQYRAMCDKSLLPLTCRLAEIDHPRAVAVEGSLHAPPFPPLPNVVKPARELEVGDEVPAVTVVRTDAERADAIARIVAYGTPAVVQEQLAGQQWGVYCAGDGRAVRGVAARVSMTAPRAAGTPSRLEVGETPAEILALARRLFAVTGYRGIANLDVIEVDGRHHLLDVNLRPAASAGLPMHAGLDLASIAMGDLIGREVRTPSPGGRRFRYVSLEGELRVLRELDGAWSRLRLTARLIADALSPGTAMDPSPTDPAWLRSKAAGLLLRRRSR